ncbi:MAG: pirin family protein [Pseudomonadota bacterium]
MQVRRGAMDRGQADLGWLHSRHSFSFGQYYDPAHMGFGPLRVINDDQVQPGRGFGTHPHRDMEIMTVVLDGALAHRDSLGTGSIIEVGDVQLMSAGTGVQHSEYNASESEPVHFLQIWIEPNEQGLTPGYQQRRFDLDAAAGEWVLIASPEARESSLMLHQDVDVYRARPAAGTRQAYRLGGPDDAPARPRQAWVQVIGGSVRVNGEPLAAGDGLAISGEDELALESLADSDLLLFDMAA